MSFSHPAGAFSPPQDGRWPSPTANGVWLAQQGLQVLSLDFSPAAQRKGEALARARGVEVTFVLADVHAWTYPESAFDVVVEIFAQFSSPPERERKWAGMRKAIKAAHAALYRARKGR